jgi:hypothetical protein
MRKSTVIFFLILTFSFLESFAHAMTYTYNPGDILLSQDNTSFSYTFDFSNDFQSITSVTLSGWFYDDTDSPSAYERVKIMSGTNVVWDIGANKELPASAPTTGNGTWDVLSYINGMTLSLNVSSINITNPKSPIGDFYFDKFFLSVEGTPKSPVPIPAAAWMLGTGLIGLVAIRRVRK